MHYLCTGRALGARVRAVQAREPALRLRAFVSATGSAGTLGAGDYLKEHYGARIVAVEALECPTMLYNGFGEHNIQGIGDKHMPLIHNVMNTDVAVAVSDRATDQLVVLFNDPAGHALLRGARRRRGVIAALPHFGLSSICNVVAAIKTAKALGLGARRRDRHRRHRRRRDVRTEWPKAVAKHFGGRFDGAQRGRGVRQHLLGAGDRARAEPWARPIATASSTSATSPGSSSRA